MTFDVTFNHLDLVEFNRIKHFVAFLLLESRFVVVLLFYAFLRWLSYKQARARIGSLYLIFVEVVLLFTLGLVHYLDSFSYLVSKQFHEAAWLVLRLFFAFTRKHAKRRTQHASGLDSFLELDWVFELALLNVNWLLNVGLNFIHHACDFDNSE